jgi:hypothetical protein
MTAEDLPVEPLDPLAQRALDLLRADPARRLAVVNDPDAITDMPTRIGYARRCDGFVFSMVLPVNISPFSLLRLLQAHAK